MHRKKEAERRTAKAQLSICILQQDISAYLNALRNTIGREEKTVLRTAKKIGGPSRFAGCRGFARLRKMRRVLGSEATRLSCSRLGRDTRP